MPLVRLGGCGDGAYLIPDDLDGIEACFSPGVDNFKNFEDELTLGYGIQCHMCDFASDIEQFQTPLVEGHQTFDKKWLDPDGVIDSISLDDWVNRYCPGSQDLILQMDIEGAEYKNILASDPVLLSRFRIIVLELHWLCDAVKEGESSQLFALLQKLYQTHRVVHAHANNCCGEHIDPGSGISIPNVIELTYLRLNRFTGNPDQYLQPLLPHPLDVPRNALFLPPLHLSAHWLSSSYESPLSIIKKLQDQLSYYEYEREQVEQDSRAHANSLCTAIRNLHRSRSSRSISVRPVHESRRLVNVSDGKSFSLSDSYMGFPHDGVVRDDPCLFFHTALGRCQSITIDLLKQSALQWLVIRNRGDCYPDRAKCLFYCIHSQPQFSLSELMPVIVSDEFLHQCGSESATPLWGARGRFLTIYSPVWTALHFSSIKVMSRRFPFI
jgi:hypothetical protein